MPQMNEPAPESQELKNDTTLRQAVNGLGLTLQSISHKFMYGAFQEKITNA